MVDSSPTEGFIPLRRRHTARHRSVTYNPCPATDPRQDEKGSVAAEEAEDDDLMAWVLATRSIQSFVGGDLYRASDLLAEARHFSAARSSCRRKAWILAMYARSLAAQRDRGRSLTALESAYHLAGQAHTPHGTDFFDLPRLEGIAGTTYLLVRETSQARSVLTTALGRRAAADAKGKALITLDLARCAAIEGDESEAHHLIGRSLDIAEHSMVHPIASQIRQMRATLRSLEGSTAGREIDERLAQAQPHKRERSNSCDGSRTEAARSSRVIGSKYGSTT